MTGEVFSMFEGTVIKSKRWVHMGEGYTGKIRNTYRLNTYKSHLIYRCFKNVVKSRICMI